MWRDDDWILPAIIIASITLGCALLLSAVTGYPASPNGVTSLKLSAAFVVVAGGWRFLRYLWELWQRGVERPTIQIGRDFRPALIGFVPVVAGVGIMALFLYSMTFLKSMIPAVVPFWADSFFAATDRALFVEPQTIAEFLAPVMAPLGVFYGLWHFANLGGILWVLHWRRASKGRYILSFMLTWVIGMACAYVFSSMGPVFVGLYDPAVADPITQRAVAFLLENLRAEGAQIGAGISAFPSLHVAVAAWFALVLRHRGLPKIGITYALAVFACSVILGWHYVADGIAGAAIALLAYRLSGQWLSFRSPSTGLGSKPVVA